jgi:4-hydroxybenzoate polyprenyltransferase
VITEKDFLKAQNSVPAWVVGAIIILGVAGVANAQQSEGLTWPVVVALGLALVSTAAGITSTVHAIRRDRRIDKESRALTSGPTSGDAG